jgi:uncharacterized membrane protein YfcA
MGQTPNKGRVARRRLFLAMAAGVVGAVLAFALEDDGASAVGVDLQAFGLVLLAAALVLAAGSAVTMIEFGPRAKETTKGEEERERAKENTDVESLKVVTGLFAVVAGVVAVAALTVVSAGLTDAESTVAVTTSALGIISTLVTAYLGIKATANTSNKAADTAAELVKKLPDVTT